MSSTPPRLGALGAAGLLDLLEDLGEHVAEEHREDRRRRFVGAEAMIVAGVRDAVAQQALPHVDRANHRGAEEQELHVVVRRVAGAQQVVAEVVADAPVQVLAGAVDAGKRLLVQQARQPVLRRHPLHRLHRHHLVIGGDVGALEDRRDFVLRRRDFVVARLDRHAALVELGLDFRHEREHALGDRAEVLILELLALRRPRAEQRAAGVQQVGTREVEVAVDQEIFLLGAAGRGDARRARSEQLQHAHGLRRERFHRAEQRRLLVERHAGPADERGRNHQRDAVVVHEQPRRAGRIPRRVAARFEGAAHAARREARRIGLAADQLLAAELRERAAVGRRSVEGVVLFGGDAGQRLEPVREVRRAVLDRPVLAAPTRPHPPWRYRAPCRASWCRAATCRPASAGGPAGPCR